MTSKLLPPLVLALLASCSPTPPVAAAHTFRVGVVPRGTSHEFWKSVERGARRADRDLAGLEIHWIGPQGEDQAQPQIDIVDGLRIDPTIDGLCLAPADARALVGPVREFLAKGRPVVLFDSGLDDASLDITALVATDNRAGGRSAGVELAETLGGVGEVAILRYMMGSESTREREQGCIDALREYPRIHIVSADLYFGPSEASAVERSENFLSAFGARVDGVFCSNESTLTGFLTALERDPRKLAGKLVVVGFDGSAEIQARLESGVLHATVLQSPEEIGYQAVMTMYKRLSGQPVERRIATRETLVRASDLDLPPECRPELFPKPAPDDPARDER